MCFKIKLLFKKLSGRRDSNPRPSAWKADALPTELLPLISFIIVGERGFEPLKAKPADLQSALVDRLSIPPISTNRADGGTRTHDLLITNQLL